MEPRQSRPGVAFEALSDVQTRALLAFLKSL